jgi:hypothetical protein
MFPGRSAARSDALQNRDLRKLRACNDPGSAVQHFVLHRIRETRLNLTPMDGDKPALRKALLQRGVRHAK